MQIGPRRGITGTTASSLGCAMDCDPLTGAKRGGGTATDDTAILQAFLNTASAATPVHLIMESCSLITGLKVVAAGYTTIEGFNGEGEFYMKPGSNSSGIESIGADQIQVSDGGSATAAGAAPARGRHVALRNFTINANRGTFTSGTYNQDGNSPGTNYRGVTYYCFGINITSINHVRVENVRVLNAPGWNLRLGNVGYAWVSGCYVREDYGTTGAPSNLYNGDGLDIVGPSNDIHINKFTAENTGDDGIALTAAVGWSGAISRVTIDGYHSINNTAAIRILAYNSPSYSGKITDVVISNVTGTATQNGIILGYTADSIPGTLADWISHVKISNCHLTAPNFISVQNDPVGFLSISNSSITPTESSPNQAVINLSAGTNIGTLILDNFTISRDASWNCYLLAVPATAHINRVEFNGVRTTSGLGQSFTALGYGIDCPGSIDRLWISSWDPTGFGGPVSSADVTNITKIQGPGVVLALLAVK